MTAMSKEDKMPGRKNKYDVIEIRYLELIRETEKAVNILLTVYVDSQARKLKIWLPKSETDFKDDMIIIIPVWLFDRKIDELRQELQAHEVEIMEYVAKIPGGK